jgi:hypothetical protein
LVAARAEKDDRPPGIARIFSPEPAVVLNWTGFMNVQREYPAGI